MANTKIVGRAAVITSTMKVEDIKKMAKYAPTSLKLQDAESKEEIFAVAAGTTASTSKYGITFSTENEAGFAQITLTIPENVDRTEYVRDTYGDMLQMLAVIEANATDALANIDTHLAEITSSIEVVD